MTDFTENTSKTWLKRRISRARQQLKSLKKIEGWSAALKPDRLRLPRRCRAGGMPLRHAILSTLIGISLLIGLGWLIIYALEKIL